MQTAPIESSQARAERLLATICPEIKKVTVGGRSHERIKMLRQVIERLILEEIPTAVIAKTLKMEQPVVQYHARWLEKHGRVIRPSKHSHWIWAKGTDEN
jgi:DNA-binding transcriptional ArsR family regulator